MGSETWKEGRKEGRKGGRKARIALLGDFALNYSYPPAARPTERATDAPDLLNAFVVISPLARPSRFLLPIPGWFDLACADVIKLLRPSLSLSLSLLF